MASTLTVLGSSVTNNSITITFSDAVDPASAKSLGNYTVYDPPSVADAVTGGPLTLSSPWTVVASGQTVTLTGPAASFNDGDYVLIGISNVRASSGDTLAVTPTTVAGQVPGTSPTARTTRDVEDAIAYPILTEEIGYRPSPVGIPVGGAGGMKGGAGGSNLGQIALSTVSDVLGWKANTADPKGFIGALTQAFTLTDVEGHVESKWAPRTYAVQTDLGGGITGAQASLYLRAKDALDQSLPLLDGLYPLDPEADPEYVKALREMARSQMTEIVKEFGVVGLPSILRIDTYFGILLGQNPGQIAAGTVQFDPDQINGTLGNLRDTYGIYFQGNPFNNSVEDESDITNFRVISDYMTSLMQSWISNRQFFVIGPGQEAFFGTQLVLISRQFSVIAETVNEVRFTLDSVFIGPAERQSLLLRFADGVTPPLYQDGTPPMYLEDIFDEIEKFAGDEGPRLLRDGGKISVTNNILPVAQTLANLIAEAHNPANVDQLPDGYRTARVQKSLDDLEDQIAALIDLILQVEQQLPPPEEFTITNVVQSGPDTTLTIHGAGIHPDVVVTIHSDATLVAAHPPKVQFYSAERVDVTFDPHLEHDSHDIVLTNPDGKSVTLHNAFTWDGHHSVITLDQAVLSTKPGTASSGSKMSAAGRRKFMIDTGGRVGALRSGRASSRAARLSRTAAQVRGQARNRQNLRPGFPTRPLVRPQPPAATPAPFPAGASAAAGTTTLSAELTHVKDEVKGLKKEFETKVSNEVGKLAEKFREFSTRSRQDQKSLKTEFEAKFKDITKMLSDMTKMNAKIAQDMNKLSGPKKGANNT